MFRSASALSSVARQTKNHPLHVTDDSTVGNGGRLAQRAGVKIIEITPAIGTVIIGLNLHASSGVPAQGDLPHVHVVYKDSSKKAPPSAFSKLELWHADVSYERQPPGLTTFKVLTNPPSGGDTLFASAYVAYDNLSPALRNYVESLSALHSGLAQGGKDHLRHQRRPPIETVHPVVRVHPVTGWKCIFVDPASTRYIVGVPKAESDMILKYLFELVANGLGIALPEAVLGCSNFSAPEFTVNGTLNFRTTA
ncbi:hypothetical protein HYPSUDRAFT_56657 [Hypholoma sublateritium FD-334 SS-4]|uniref:TauD/TfdA-like domain-containing protein n=1 Tax=Hypholoma sublateritium (strain FD-334 SS-4) TaxID=945553 RepID=A0A0D2M7Y4_HYPSF|nr:hypothetical protein HYPSUDRAFT_56657 [Hypholoma sublateritium FD-334 SS-4]